MKTKSRYDIKVKNIARVLRKQCTLGEIVLWGYLKNRLMKGYKFTRQKAFNGYVLDFFCHDLMLAIEIDGCSHDFRADNDMKRQGELEKSGVRFLRYTEGEILKETESVLEGIENWIEEYAGA